MNIIRIRTIPVVYPDYYDPEKRADAIMGMTEDLFYDYVMRGHKSCPLLWSERKWLEFLKEKVEDAIPMLRYNTDMNMPPDY